MVIDAARQRQTRRKVALEMLSLAVPTSSAVYFSGDVIAGWAPQVTVPATALTAVACLAFLLWHRSRFPASVATWGSSDEPPSDDEVEDDEGGRWDLFTILLFVVSLTAVVVAGVVVRFAMPLAVIVLFVVVDSESDLGDAAFATLAMLGAAAVVELVVVIPLSRLWDLSIDEPPGLLASLYPVRPDQP
jgi:hypothetical protein